MWPASTKTWKIRIVASTPSIGCAASHSTRGVAVEVNAYFSTMDDLARVARPGFKTGLKPHRERRRRIEVDWRWCGGNIT